MIDIDIKQSCFEKFLKKTKDSYTKLVIILHIFSVKLGWLAKKILCILVEPCYCRSDLVIGNSIATELFIWGWPSLAFKEVPIV